MCFPSSVEVMKKELFRFLKWKPKKVCEEFHIDMYSFFLFLVSWISAIYLLSSYRKFSLCFELSCCDYNLFSQLLLSEQIVANVLVSQKRFMKFRDQLSKEGLLSRTDPDMQVTWGGCPGFCTWPDFSPLRHMILQLPLNFLFHLLSHQCCEVSMMYVVFKTVTEFWGWETVIEL